MVAFSAIDLLGFVASGLVLLTFSMRSMVGLRAVALLSNVAFIGYGFGEALAPVILLHALLLPMNATWLWRAWRCRPRFDQSLEERSFVE